MAEDRQQEEIVVSFDYSGDSLRFAETEDGDFEPGVHSGEARIEVDPLVEAFVRNPYDPVVGSMMMGRATGEVIARPPEASWMRAIAGLMATGMIVQFPVATILLLRAEFAAIQLASPSFVLSGLMCLGGLLLAVRLLRTSGN